MEIRVKGETVVIKLIKLTLAMIVATTQMILVIIRILSVGVVLVHMRVSFIPIAAMDMRRVMALPMS